MALYITVASIFILTFIAFRFLRPKKPINEVPEKREFKMVDKFNENAYIGETFKQVIHSIKIDNWYKEVTDGLDKEIRFVKKPENGSSWDEVKLTVKYEESSGEFKIRGIYLSAGEFFSYDIKNLSVDDYEFFYNCYVSHVNQQNKNTKERVDKSLSKIHSVIGKSSIRDSKIDQLLSGKKQQ